MPAAASSAPLKGFGVTFKQIFKKPITQQYPEYKRPVYPRFRGRHRLHRHENGLEKCVGCSLCAAACPADCIRVVAAENTPENRVSAGERYARIYEINLSPLHLLRLLRARLPVRRDHARQRVRALRVLARRPDLHEGHAARRADQAGPGRRPRPLRHARSRPTRARLVADGRTSSSGWSGSSPPARCLGSGVARRHLHEPVLLGARADRQPRLARRALPAARRASSSPRRRCSSTRAR